jgi:hypothetical protein
MMRTGAVLVLLLAACGSKNSPDVCKEVPAPAACSTTCTPGGADTCPAGFFCSPSGTCDAQCTQGGDECGAGMSCSPDGMCVANGSGADANCPDVHFMAMKTTPSIELLLDRSGSMAMNDISPTRYKALHTALTGAMGAITQTQADVYFGAALFTGDEDPCPPNANLDGYSVPRSLNNATAIDTLISSNNPTGSTPTADWVTAVTADFAANPPPMGSPPIILLATDGEPNACGNGNDNGAAVAAAQAAYAAGVRLFIIGLELNDQTAIQFLQDMANAGTGMPTGQAPMCAGCAPYYTANNPADLVTGLNSIISGVLSCDLTLSGQVDPTQASQGTVTLNGTQLTYGTDWTITGGGTTLQLLGSACTMLQQSTNPQVDASFPCGDVIIQ